MKSKDWLWIAGGLAVLLVICLLVYFAVTLRLRETAHPTQLAVGTTPGLLQPTSTLPSAASLPSTPVLELTPTFASTLPPSPVAPNPAAGKIVFVCQEGANRICIMNADGSGVRRLTDGSVKQWYPSLAPDGNSVVYSAWRMNNVYEIYEITLDGVVTQLTNKLGVLVAPEISPDGKSIVFTRGDAVSTQAIWVMERDGSNPHQVFGPPQANGWDPTWSPDGTQILFASNMDGSNQLYVVNLDGTGLRQVSRLAGIRGRSDWSADGRLIGTYAGSDWLWELFFMSPDGSGLRQVTNGGSNLAPSFSPDSQWVVFTSYMDDYQDPYGCEIYIMRIDGSELTRLTYNGYCDYQPRWGP